MGKSPFATPKVITYTYPEPFNYTELDGEPIPEEIQGVWNGKIDPEEVDEGHWVKIRVPKARGDVDSLGDATQSMMIAGGNGDGMKFEQRIAYGNRAAFELLIEGWSFDAEPSGSNYAKLDDWSGDWISACVIDAIRRGQARDFAKKTKSFSPKPDTSESDPSQQTQEESLSQ